MIGLSRNGQTLTGWALYQQHVIDVLSTPVGSRIKRRKYGSKIPILLGKTLSAHVMTLAQVYAIEAFIVNTTTSINTCYLMLKRKEHPMVLR